MGFPLAFGFFMVIVRTLLLENTVWGSVLLTPKNACGTVFLVYYTDELCHL